MLRLPFRHHPSRLEVFLSLALKEGIKNIYSTTFINICCKSHRIHLSLFTPYHEFNNMGNEYICSCHFAKMIINEKKSFKLLSDKLQSVIYCYKLSCQTELTYRLLFMSFCPVAFCVLATTWNLVRRSDIVKNENAWLLLWSSKMPYF